jgi:hypothetical protein
MRRVLLGMAILATVTTGAEAQTLKMDVPAGLTLSTVGELEPKKDKENRPEGKPNKKMFKDLRPGQCPTTTFSSPVSSWPARGQALVAVCRR